MLGAEILFALVGLMGLYAALRPEQYARYLLARRQRERISGNFKALSLTGWGIFIFCIVVVVGIVLQGLIRPYGAVLEAGLFLVVALAWLWWGISLLLRPDSFIRRANARLPLWVIKIFGIVLLLGAGKFVYEFVVRTRALLR
jgi:uncharacterized protein YhhL (DUF1145 family)